MSIGFRAALLLSSSLAAWVASPVHAQSTYSFVELRSSWLSTSELTNPLGQPMALNASGVAVGSVRKVTGYQPDVFGLKWVPVYAVTATQWPAGSSSPTSLASPAGTLSGTPWGAVARGVDDSGRVVGFRHFNNPQGSVATQPVVWIRGVPALLSSQSGVAQAVHAQGGVVGHRVRDASELPATEGIPLVSVRQAVFWQGGGHIDIHPPGVPVTVNSEAVAVNAAGDVAVVTTDPRGGLPSGCHLHRAGASQRLPVPENAACRVTDLNDLGVAVGEVRLAGAGEAVGAWWPQGQLQWLPAGFLPSAINRVGLVAGRTSSGAAVWAQGVLRPLTGRVKGVPSGALIVDVTDLNDQGRMIVAAHFPKAGGAYTLRWGVLTPQN